MMARHKKYYKDSPHLERNEESGRMGVKKGEAESAEVNAGTEGIDVHESHAHDRRAMHHRHIHEHMQMHHSHEMEHAMHKGHNEKLHEKHEHEYSEMHKRHHSEMKSMHKMHEKGGEGMMKKEMKSEKTGGEQINKVEKEK